jgi:hypothetical protein
MFQFISPVHTNEHTAHSKQLNIFVSCVAREKRTHSYKHILKMQAAAQINDISTLIFCDKTTHLDGWIYLGSMYILQQDMLHNKGKCDKMGKYI